MAVYDVSPYLGAQSGRSRTMSGGSPYPAARSRYDVGNRDFNFSAGGAAWSAIRASPFGSLFSPLSLFSSFSGNSQPRFAGGAGATRISPRVAEAQTVARTVAGVPRGATADDYRTFLSGTAAGQMPSTEEQPFIGGYPADFVYETYVPGQRGAGPLEGDAPRRTASTLYGRPLYREGAAYAFLSDLGEEGIRSWQAFFAGLGFKTGPAGIISQNDIEAMNAFMGMANGVPGGGMKVENLRGLVMDQVRAGIYFFRGVNETGDLLPTMLGAEASGDLTGGGGTGPGGTGEYMGPTTETMIRNIVQEISMDQGMLALRNVVANEIGRAPTEAEVREFVRRANAAFRADPTVITQVTTSDPTTGESTTEITEDETDVNPEGMALGFVEEDLPEGERYEYQAGRYFDTIMSAIGL